MGSVYNITWMQIHGGQHLGATFGGPLSHRVFSHRGNNHPLLNRQETGIATCWQYKALKTKDLGDFDDFGKAPPLLMSLLSLSLLLMSVYLLLSLWLWLCGCGSCGCGCCWQEMVTGTSPLGVLENLKYQLEAKCTEIPHPWHTTQPEYVPRERLVKLEIGICRTNRQNPETMIPCSFLQPT